MLSQIEILWWHFPLLFAVGIVVAFINAVAGGGSVVSLPLLIFLGLPSPMANGTNRIGIFLGSLSSVLAFRKKGHFNPRLIARVGIPSGIGAVAGSLLAVRIPENIFNPILAGVIVLVVWMTLRPHSQKIGNQNVPAENDAMASPQALLAFAALGFYGGFIQAGVGFVMIYVFNRFSHMNLLEVNALKVATTFLFTFIAIVLFAAFGQIDWLLGSVLAFGSWAGGWLGTVWQVKKGEIWIKRVLFTMGLLSAGKLIADSIFA